jgi:hypothetical protein
MVRGAHTGLLSIGVLLVDSGLIGLPSALALSFSDRLLDVGTARLVAYGSDIVFETVFAPAGVLIVAASVTGLRSKLLPRWLGWGGLLVGVLLFVTFTFASVSGVLLWLWVGAASIVLTRHAKPATA